MAETAPGEGAPLRKSSVQLISKAAAILDVLSEWPEGLEFTQLVVRTSIPKATVHRLCRALEEVGYVATDPSTGRRRLGPRLMRIAVAARGDLRSLLEPHMVNLSRELNETVDLAVLDGRDVLHIASHTAPERELVAIARIGIHFPAHTMASGKVLLAALSPTELRRRLPRGLKRAEREALLEELKDVRASGLAYDLEGFREGICAVAVAIVDADGTSVAVSVPMPAARFREDEDRVVAALLRMHQMVEARLLTVADPDSGTKTPDPLPT